MFSQWYKTVLVDLLHEGNEPIEWRNMHVEPKEESLVNTCRLLTNVPQRHWEGQADRQTDLAPGIYRYKTAFISSLDVETAFDVGKLLVVSFLLIGVSGHVVAAFLAEMQDVRGSACFENCETAFRYSRCIRQGGVEAVCCGGAWPNACFGKPRKNGRPEGGNFPFERKHDDDNVLR